MEYKLWATLILFVGAVSMILGLRLNNQDPAAGRGVAGWTIVIMLSLWYRGCS